MDDTTISLRELYNGMDTDSRAEDLRFFRNLVTAPGPSGFEMAAQRVFIDYAARYADEVRTDVHGNAVAIRRGTGNKRVMVVGHADEVGLMVRYIDDEGFLYVSPIGGVDTMVLPGLRVDVHHEGAVIQGVVGRKAIHVLEEKERKEAPKFADLWIDIGAANREEAEKHATPGDFITFPAGLDLLGERFLVSKATDNKCGVYVAAAVLKELHGEQINAGVYAVSAAMEEVGSRGAATSAFGIQPDVALVIDVGNVSDVPGCEKKRLGDISLGKGPEIAVGATCNTVVVRRLRAAAAQLGMAVQTEVDPSYSGTDADTIQIVRSGVPCGVISVPNRYMHTPSEMICWDDLQQTVKLVAAFIRALDEDEDFRPVRP